MTRNSLMYIGSTLGAVALLACGEPTTEPETTRPLSTTMAGPGRWITRAQMGHERAFPAAGTVTDGAGQSILYVIGGLTPDGVASRAVQAYDVTTNTWTMRAPTPIRVYATNGVGVIGGKLYISGGITPPTQARRRLYVYDPATNTWTKKSSMPSPGHHGLTGVINNQLYVLTGCGFLGVDCDEPVPLAFFRYDPVSDRWGALPAPTNAHSAGAGGVIGGKFYVTGGDGVSQLEVYDPATNVWTIKASMPGNRWFGASVAFQAQLYVIGGVERDPDGVSTLVRTTSVYDPATDAWTTRAPIPEERASLAASRVLRNGQARIELVGGTRPGNNLQFIP